MSHVPIVPPPCIEDGEPPCPICRARYKCAWASRVLDEDKAVRAKYGKAPTGVTTKVTKEKQHVDSK